MTAQVEIDSVGKLKGGSIALWIMVAILGGGSGVQLVNTNAMAGKIVTREVFEVTQQNVVDAINGLRTDIRGMAEREGPTLTRIALLEREILDIRRQIAAQQK